MAARTLSLFVLISGRGSNLQAIIDTIAQGRLNARICEVLSDKAAAAGLRRATQAGITTRVLEARGFPDREAYDAALQGIIDGYHPDLIILAGFMRLLTPAFVARYANRMLNIHPALLPNYKGLNTHQRVLAAKEARHGASVHLVTADVDSGPVIAHMGLNVLANETAEGLSDRVLRLEHQLYPAVIGWFCEGRIEITAQGVQLDGEDLPVGGKEIVVL
jgi:phosphoribosylglycinamide formyltransferase-1